MVPMLYKYVKCLFIGVARGHGPYKFFRISSHLYFKREYLKQNTVARLNQTF